MWLLEQENFRLERESLCREIDELRISISATERTAARREEEMRRERQELLQRLEESEHRHEELSGRFRLLWSHSLGFRFLPNLS